MIALRNVTKRFAGTKAAAVDGVSFEVGEGKTLVLLGSSGSGKTTTLRMINGLTEASSGSILVDGEDVAGRDLLELRRSIGYVFQDIGLFGHMTVEQNVALPGRVSGWPGARRATRARELLELVGLDPAEYGARKPRELSGGQRQRVGIARALLREPRHMLMDEPFGALDAITRHQMQAELVRLREALGITIVFVTHDVFEAFKLGDTIGVMHEGRLEQIGTPSQIIESPETPFVSEVLERTRSQVGLLAGGTTP